MDTEKMKWFAARTRNGQALYVRGLLEKYNVEYFIPTQFVLRERNHKRFEEEKPLISNLVFLRTTKAKACSLANEFQVPVFYLIDSATHSMMVVPDKQMNDFMQVLDLSPESLCLSELPFKVGCKVMVVKGEFSGIEGEMLGMATRTYVIVRVGSLLAAKVKVPKAFLVVKE